MFPVVRLYWLNHILIVFFSGEYRNFNLIDRDKRYFSAEAFILVDLDFLFEVIGLPIRLSPHTHYM